MCCREFNKAVENYEMINFVWVTSELKYRPSLETVDLALLAISPDFLARRLKSFTQLEACPWLSLLILWLKDHHEQAGVALFESKFRTMNYEQLLSEWPDCVIKAVPPIHKRLFGEPLESVNGGELPEAILSMIKWMSKAGQEVDGIFRISADSTALEWLKSLLNAGKNVELERCSPHEVASLLKLYFRSLPVPIVPPSVQGALPDTDEPEEAIQVLRSQILPNLTPQSYALLRALMHMLWQVAQHEQVNRMGARNLAICWAPNLIYDEHAKDQFRLLKASLGNTELMIREYGRVFQK